MRNPEVIDTLISLCNLPDDKGSGRSQVTVYTTVGPFSGYPEVVGEAGDTFQIATNKRGGHEIIVQADSIVAVRWRRQ